MTPDAIFEAAGLTAQHLQALRDMWAETSPVPDPDQALLRAVDLGLQRLALQITRADVQRRAALLLLEHDDPQDAGRTAVLHNHLRLALGHHTDQPLTPADRAQLLGALIGDRLEQLAQQGC